MFIIFSLSRPKLLYLCKDFKIIWHSYLLEIFVQVHCKLKVKVIFEDQTIKWSLAGVNIIK